MTDDDPFIVSEAGAIGLLAKVVAGGEFVYIHFDGDVYHGVQVRQIAGRPRRYTAQHQTVLGLIRSLEVGGKLELEPTRMCPGCPPADNMRRWGQFSMDEHGPAGLCRLCKVCERKRIRKYSDRKKAAAAFAAAVASIDATQVDPALDGSTGPGPVEPAAAP